MGMMCDHGIALDAYCPKCELEIADDEIRWESPRRWVSAFMVLIAAAMSLAALVIAYRLILDLLVPL